jgi:predicted CXXCH cytochrome family protein
MPTRLVAVPVACVLALAFGAAVRAGENRLAPIAKAEATSTHGPYEMGACDICHERSDARNPGAALKVSNDLCFECHDEFKGTAPVRMESAVHPSTKASCTLCHNPHNSRKKKLRL